MKEDKLKLNFIIFIFFFSFLLRVGYIFFCQEFNPLGYEDARRYDAYAKNIINGEGFCLYSHRHKTLLKSYDPPLYPCFLSVIYFFFDEELRYKVVVLIQALLGAITCLLILYLNNFDEKIKKLASILYAVYPYGIYYTAYLLSETLFIFFFILWCVLFLKKQTTTKREIINGIYLGMMSHIREFSLLLFFFYLLYKLKNKLFFQAMVLTCVFFLSLLPWGIRNYLLHNRLILISSKGGITFWIANNKNSKGYHTEPDKLKKLLPKLKERDYSIGYIETLKFFREMPTVAIYTIILKFLHLIYPIQVGGLFFGRYGLEYDIGFGIIFFLSIFGIVLYLKDKGFNILLLPILSLLLQTFLLYGCERFRLPIIPILLLFSAYSIAYLIKRSWGILLLIFLILINIIFLFFPTLVQV